jgi:N-acetyl-alpha-D-muramate 1-phosphate uridylyltransferase
LIPPAVILAGGLATRLYPATKTLPKSLVEIAGKPFIHHQLALLREKGIRQVVLCLGSHGEMIEKYVGDGSVWGLELRYSYDGNVLLGTGGAVRKALSLLPDTFFILYGDSYLDIDYSAVIERFYDDNQPVLMTIYRNQNAFDTSNILMEEGKILKYDKKSRDQAMEYIDYGFIVIRKDVFFKYPANESFDLSLVLSGMVDSEKVAAFVVEKRFYEIGSIQGIRETEEYIRHRTQSSLRQGNP